MSADHKIETPPAAGYQLAPEERRRQRSRNLAIAWALVGMAVMFFLVTIAKLGPGVLNRPL